MCERAKLAFESREKAELVFKFEYSSYHLCLLIDDQINNIIASHSIYSVVIAFNLK